MLNNVSLEGRGLSKLMSLKQG